MSIKVKFDKILGRLREGCKCDGGTPTPPPTPTLAGTTTPSANQSYLADAQLCPGMTVEVRLRLDGTLVDADTTPQGWTHVETGVYQRHIDNPGTVAAQTWHHTTAPGSIYGQQTASYTSPARTLSAVYPAYWGIYPSSDAAGDITAIVAALKDQHRVTQNLPQTVVTVDNPTANDCWLWIVTHGTAKATPEAFDISMMEDPVTGKTFTSPMANWQMNGYKAYVSINRADAGLSFGPVKLTINL